MGTLCAILGDCIALGLAVAHPGCATDAVMGRTSGTIAHHVPSGHFDYAVISAGSNDPTNPSLKLNLRSIRSRIDADRVVWLVPVNRVARAAVEQVASEYNDRTVDFTPGADHVHPRSYVALWRSVRPKLQD